MRGVVRLRWLWGLSLESLRQGFVLARGLPCWWLLRCEGGMVGDVVVGDSFESKCEVCKWWIVKIQVRSV